MKSKIIIAVKIYSVLTVYILLSTFLYSYFLLENKITESKIIELIIPASSFLLLGILYSNHVHKKGLLVGSLTGLIHYFTIKLISFLITGTYSFNLTYFLIIILSSVIGGILGLLFKKII